MFDTWIEKYPDLKTEDKMKKSLHNSKNIYLFFLYEFAYFIILIAIARFLNFSNTKT